MKDNKRQAHLRFSPHGIRPGDKFAGGTYLASVPAAMRDRNSLHRKLLALLIHVRDTTGLALLPRELAEMYLDKYGEAEPNHAIGRTLSVLFTLGLAKREAINFKDGRWSVKPGVSDRDEEALIALCEYNLAKLHEQEKQAEPKVSRLPMHGEHAADILREASK